MKTYLQALVLACCVFLLSSCGRSDSSRITAVLEQCAAVAHQAANVPGGQGAQADFIAREFQKIDVTSCPADFRMAYQAHVLAWQQAAGPLGNNNPGTAALEGVASGLAQDPRYLGQAAQEADYASQQINATYAELTQIAARYGARIPRAVAGE